MILRTLNKLLGAMDLRLVRASTHWNASDLRKERSFLHARPAGSPDVRFHLPEFEVETADLELAERVVDAFHAAMEYEQSLYPEGPAKNDVWEKIALESQSGFRAVLQKRDVSAVAEVLVNALHHQVSYGLNTDANVLTYDVARSSNERSQVADVIVDRLIGLAEATGELPVEFPEWGRWGENVYSDLDEVCKRVEKTIGFDLRIPECFGLYGIRAGDRVITPMTALLAYGAWRSFEILSEIESPSICEIGGGYGGCAYYAFQHALDRYVIIDLPMVNVLQGYFLMKTCGGDKVHLFGEKESDRPLQVLPYWMAAKMPDKSFDLTINQESLPEINHVEAKAYIADIARMTRRWFLSINQESQALVHSMNFRQGVVAELCREHGGYRRVRRTPFWLRHGDVEEVFEITAAASHSEASVDASRRPTEIPRPESRQADNSGRVEVGAIVDKRILTDE